MADCNELNDLRNDISAIDNPDSFREIFLTNYVDAYLACNPGQQELLAAAVIEQRRDPVSIADAIVDDMGRNQDTALKVEILALLSQINSSKRPIAVDDQRDDAAHAAVDPVMLFKGQFVHEVIDIQIDGAGIEFVFARTYKNQTVFNGPLGHNWTHNFHVWLRVGDRVIFRSTGDLRFGRVGVANHCLGPVRKPDGTHWADAAQRRRSQQISHHFCRQGVSSSQNYHLLIRQSVGAGWFG